MAFSVKTKNNEVIKLEDNYFASGGEGLIHKIISPTKYKDCCVKIYKDCISTKKKNEQTVKEREQKISYMVQNPPPRLSANQWLLTWPKDVIYEQNGNFLGFIMSLAFDKSVELFQLTNIKTSSKLSSEWDKFDRSSGEGVKRRLMLNANIAIAVHHLHASNKYVIVDMKPQNFLVSPEGKVTVLDIDTVQISNNGSVMFPSKAMTPEYIPPEIKKIQNGDKVPVEWDRFILSLIFYEVLFGIHPYAGNGFKAPYTNSTTIKDNISNGLFPFGQKSQYFNNIPKPHLNFKNIPLKVQNLFINSFEVDISNTHKRPTAEEWGKTLYTMIKEGQQLAAQKNIVEEQQREKDWQNCNKNSIQSLLEFRKKYNNQGKYTQKALQLINDIRTKNNQSTSNTAVTTKPTTQTQTTNTSYSNSELKKRVNRSLTYSILFLIIPNIIINLFFMIIYGEFELKWLFFSTISLNLPNLVLKITAIFAIIFSGIAKSRYNNYNYSKCEKPLKTAKVFKWITIILTGLYVILRMID